MEAPTDPKIVSVVDRGLGPQGPPLFVILLEVGVFVIDVQGGRPASAVGGGPSLHLATKDQLHLFGTAQINVLANDLLEKAPAMDRAVPNLSEGELHLENRNVVAVAGLAVLGAEGVRQTGQPLAKHRLDLLGGQPLAQPLSPRHVPAGQQPVIQGLEADGSLGQLSL